jgi:hypothetical protein
MLKSFDESHAANNPFDQFKDWWEEFALPDYTNKNALNAHIYPFRVECMINAKAFYLIPKNLWEPTFYELGIKI